ncbi:MAG: hypothetical protein Q9192_004361, partial [Flavoplaca navasiana]
STANAAHAAFWLIYQVLRHPNVPPHFRAEIEKAEKQSPPDTVLVGYDIAELCRSPLLQSIYAETLRLHVSNIILRSPVEDFKIRNWRISPGEIIAIMCYPLHHDRKVYDTGTPDDPRPLDDFWADRFLVPKVATDQTGASATLLPATSASQPPIDSPHKFSLKGLEGSWVPYGGGSYICPGRQFAKQEVLLNTALLLGNYEIELTGSPVEMDWRFFGTGSMGVKVSPGNPQLESLSVDNDSKLNYQGHNQRTIRSTHRGSVSYLAELDVHFPTLTVGETLLIARRARTPGQTTIPIRKRRRPALDEKRDSIASLALSSALNTRVGNDTVRGVSGGERKRLSIAELLLAQTTLHCWDNSTRGLDISNAMKFVTTLRRDTQAFRTTAIVSLYQASEELYKMFDKVILLDEGQQIYFGKTGSAKSYMEKRGFLCPRRVTTPDFLTSITNSTSRRKNLTYGLPLLESAGDLAQAWKKSPEYQDLIEEISIYNSEHPRISSLSGKGRLLHQQLTSDSSGFLGILAVLIHLSFDNVHGIPDHRFNELYLGWFHGAGGGVYADADDVYRLHAADTFDAPMVPLVQLFESQTSE